MKEQLMSLGDSLVPALRPAARLLIITDSPDEKTGLHLNGRARAAYALKRVGEVATGAGHLVHTATEPTLVDNETPEVVLVDGSSHHVVAMLERARRDDATKGAVFLALTTSKMRDELLEALRAAGADEFLGADAQNFEIMARLEAATVLMRAKPKSPHSATRSGAQIRVDDLTGVMSRRFFFQQAYRECSRARRYGHRLSCVMIEVDHFKSLAVTFGDAAGEAICAASPLSSASGRAIATSSRVLPNRNLPFCCPKPALTAPPRAQDKITIALTSHRWIFEGRELPVSVSIGESELQAGAAYRRVAGDYITEGDESGEVALSTRESLAGLLEDADAALFVARKGARMPDVLVPYTPVPEVVVTSRRPKKRDTPPGTVG